MSLNPEPTLSHTQTNLEPTTGPGLHELLGVCLGLALDWLGIVLEVNPESTPSYPEPTPTMGSLGMTQGSTPSHPKQPKQPPGSNLTLDYLMTHKW